MYAVDTSPLFSSKSTFRLIDRLNIDLITISYWFAPIQLIINERKHNFMVFRRKNKQIPTVPPPVCIDNASINRV